MPSLLSGYRMDAASPGITSEFQACKKRTNTQKDKPTESVLSYWGSKHFTEVLFSKYTSHWPEMDCMGTFSSQEIGKKIISYFPNSVMESGREEMDYIWVVEPNHNVCHTDKCFAWRIEMCCYSSLGYEPMSTVRESTIYLHKKKFRAWLGWQKQWYQRLTELRQISVVFLLE